MCNNHAAICGGGLYLGVPADKLSSKTLVYNNLIANNNGNGVRVRSDTCIFTNNTIVNNAGYGIFSNDFSKYMKIENCISWGNQKPGIFVITPELHILNSDIEGLQMNQMHSFMNPSAGYGTGYDGYSANWNLQNSIWFSEKGKIDTTAGTTRLGFIYSQNNIIPDVNLSLNSSEDILTVKISVVPKNARLIIINMKEVVFQEQELSSSKTLLKVGDLPKGLYFVKIISGKAETLLRFEKK